MNIELKRDDFNLLVRYVPQEIGNNISFIEYNNKVQISVVAEELEAISESLSTSFIEFGLEKDGEPNSIGLRIESVIDVIDRYLYRND